MTGFACLQCKFTFICTLTLSRNYCVGLSHLTFVLPQLSMARYLYLLFPWIIPDSNKNLNNSCQYVSLLKKFTLPSRISTKSHSQCHVALYSAGKILYKNWIFLCFYSSPTPDQRRDVCRAIVTKFPFLADAGGGYVIMCL